MDSIFANGVLERIATSDTLLAFDFDGTLAPIVGDPKQAAMRGSTRRLLAQLAHVYPCAVISGRPEEDVLRLLAGVTVWYVIGNRALQAQADVERLFGEVHGWLPPLIERLAPHAGISVEDKGVSLAIHYRHARQHEAARAIIGEAIRGIQGARIVDGKEVVNVLPKGGASKGVAVDRIRTQLRSATTLYAGDDGTDEDVFALPDLVGVRVGEPAGGTAARYSLIGQEEIDELLERLVELRPRRMLRPESRWRPSPRKYE
ncbi:MAG TPA: trehalose-phosphatase [Myxococcales bacterium]|jgi:trehalose 6-phosphate phosphatase|nr:trehalose-phosphatase [Myxococcales bacterium]